MHPANDWPGVALKLSAGAADTWLVGTSPATVFVALLALAVALAGAVVVTAERSGAAGAGPGTGFLEAPPAAPADQSLASAVVREPSPDLAATQLPDPTAEGGGTPAAADVDRERSAERSRPAAATSYPIVRVTRPMPIRQRPGSGPTLGTLQPRSEKLGNPMSAWVMDRTADGRYGLVSIPWSGSDRTGWVDLRGSKVTFTPVRVEVDLSERELIVHQGGKVVLRTPAAVGGPSSPTSVGRYFVTDLVDTRRMGATAYGAYAFGLSGIQRKLRPGWDPYNNQLAIHGTSDPSSIGRAVSAGCPRVSDAALMTMKRLVRAGTPVVIHG